MLSTLEVRWFVPGSIPDVAARWFDSLGPAVEPESRTDRYLIPSEGEDLGLKVREGRVEAKQRTASGELRAWPTAEARPEAWRKWSLGLATDEDLSPGWVDVVKVRRQRWIPGEEAGCALELAEVELAGATWWSVCLEASGGVPSARQRVFAEASSSWLDRPNAPTLPLEQAMGYPAWLRREMGQGPPPV